MEIPRVGGYFASKGADRAGKFRILDEMVELTGWGRDYALTALFGNHFRIPAMGCEKNKNHA